MPITLGATSSTPEWNRNILICIWVSQFFMAAIFSLMTLLALAFGGGGSLYVLPTQT